MTGPGDPTFDYLTGQMNAAQAPLIAAFEREGAEAVAAHGATLDIAYGPHPRQRFDLFRAKRPRATLVYLHAGYWQSRDKAQFRFLAPPFLAAHCHVALGNYPLCPDVTIAALTEAVRPLLPAVAQAADGLPLIVAGHSAGGHLAVELALTDRASRGATAPRIAAVVGLSGVYDLVPLLSTRLNDKLQLDPSSATRASPLSRVKAGGPAALFAVGALETAAFQRQTLAMAQAWAAAGTVEQHRVVAGADHFSLLRAFATGDLHQAVLALIGPDAVQNRRETR